MHATTERQKRLAHEGELHLHFELKHYGDINFRSHVYATSKPSEKDQYLAIGMQSGSIYVVHRREGEKEFGTLDSVLHTGYNFPLILSLSPDADYLALMDTDRIMHVFRKGKYGSWKEQKISFPYVQPYPTKDVVLTISNGEIVYEYPREKGNGRIIWRRNWFGKWKAL